MTIRFTVKHEQPDSERPIRVSTYQRDQLGNDIAVSETIIAPGEEEHFHVHRSNFFNVTEA